MRPTILSRQLIKKSTPWWRYYPALWTYKYYRVRNPYNGGNTAGNGYLFAAATTPK